MSNLKVSVQWRNSAVQAGDVIECKITFRNVCSPIDSHRLAYQLQSSTQGGDGWVESLPASVGNPPSRKPPSHAAKNFHPNSATQRSTCSYDTPLSIRRASDYRIQNRSANTVPDTNHKSHKRSISIVSIGDEVLPMDKSHTSIPSIISKRPSRAHGRALSVQALPRAGLMTSKPVPGKQ